MKLTKTQCNIIYKLEKMNYKESKNKINSRENNRWKFNKTTKEIQHTHT